MQAIETVYFGPGNSHGSRIKANAWAGSITIPYDGALTTEGAHRKAAIALATKLNWPGEYIGGGSANGHGYVWVNIVNHNDSFMIERDNTRD